MTTSKSSEYERRLLTPKKTFHIKPSKLPKTKNLTITHQGQNAYSVTSSSAPFSSKVTVSINPSQSNKGSVFATAKLNSKDNGFTIFLGDPDTDPSAKVEEDLDASMIDRNFRFALNGQKYAWQNTCRHSIRIPAADGQGVAEETNGQDWKLIKMSSSEPKIDDQILAAFISERNTSSFHGQSGAANLHWFEDIGDDVEKAGLVALMGMLERQKRSAKEWNSGTALFLS